MSPRFDHRPPIIAFLFLVVLAIAVVGTNARALDRTVVAGAPIAARVHVSGEAVLGGRPVATRAGGVERARPFSRGNARPGHGPQSQRELIAHVHRAAPGKRARGHLEQMRAHIHDLHALLSLGRHFRLH